MIRLTKQADYGIVLMTQLAATDRSYNAPDLAAETHLPLPMVSKTLKILSKRGLLDSQRGAKGGYRLAGSAEEISVADVISALEGPIALTECVEDTEECSYESFCRVRSNWQRINDAVTSALRSISLREMATTALQQPITADLLGTRPAAESTSQDETLVSLGRE